MREGENPKRHKPAAAGHFSAFTQDLTPPKLAKRKGRKMKTTRQRPRCPVCGYRIRGRNHNIGHHHQQAEKSTTSAAR